MPFKMRCYCLSHLSPGLWPLNPISAPQNHPDTVDNNTEIETIVSSNSSPAVIGFELVPLKRSMMFGIICAVTKWSSDIS